MIHFVTCRLRNQVHVQGQGYTHVLYLYAWGNDAGEAHRHAMAYLIGQGMDVETISPPRVAMNQALQRFTHPEQIYGLPADLAEQELRTRDYPEDILLSSLVNLADKQRIVRLGLARLLAAA